MNAQKTVMHSVPARRGVALCCFSKPSSFARTGLGQNTGRQLFTRCSGQTRRSGSGWLSRFLSSEAKTTVRAIPVEAGTRAKWTGKVYKSWTPITVDLGLAKARADRSL